MGLPAQLGTITFFVAYSLFKKTVMQLSITYMGYPIFPRIPLSFKVSIWKRPYDLQVAEALKI